MSRALDFGFAVALLVVGLANYCFAYRIAWVGERLDAIGSTTPASEVEPAYWNVALTRFVGIVALLTGLFIVATRLPVFP